MTVILSNGKRTSLLGIEPTSPSLTIVTTQQQLDDAINAIPDGFTGKHVIEVRTSGLFINRAKMPMPAVGTSGKLDLIADRSTVTTSSPSHTFVKDATTAVQFEDTTTFSAHAGITAGDFWVEQDISVSGPEYTTNYFAALPTSSPDVRVMAGFAPWGTSGMTVYPRSITLDLQPTAGHANAQLDGGGALNEFGFGVRFIGFVIDCGTGASSIRGCTFLACDYRGFGRYDNCHLDGFIGTVGGTNQITLDSAYGATKKGKLDGLHAVGGAIQLYGTHRLGILVSEVSLSLDEGAQITSMSDADYRLTGGACITYRGGGVINTGTAEITLGTGADRFIAPSANINSLTGAQIYFDPSAVITGTVALEGIVVQNGGSCVNADSACDGTLVVTSGDELVLDGLAYNFADVVDTIFSLTTGSFLRT